MGSNDPNESDEEILNVLRRSDEEYMSTKEIANDLSIGKRRTGGRLNELENKRRVERKEFGQTNAWKLAEGEPQQPVNRELGNIIYWSTWTKKYSQDVQQIGKLFLWFGAGFVVLSLTASVQNVSFPLLTNTQLLVLGYGFLLGSGAIYLTAGLFRLGSFAGPRVVERRLKQREKQESS